MALSGIIFTTYGFRSSGGAFVTHTLFRVMSTLKLRAPGCKGYRCYSTVTVNGLFVIDVASGMKGMVVPREPERSTDRGTPLSVRTTRRSHCISNIGTVKIT